MILIACVDDGMGMAFNHRRQSRDARVTERILSRTAGSPLWMSPYSAKLLGENPWVSPDFLSCAGAQEFAFTELETPGIFAERVEEIILYRWNRAYPADIHFDLDLSGWKLVSTTEFAGTSHEKITEEVYTR